MDRILYLAAPQKRHWIRNTGEMQGALSYEVLLLGTNNGPRTSLTILLSFVKDVYIFTVNLSAQIGIRQVTKEETLRSAHLEPDFSVLFLSLSGSGSGLGCIRVNGSSAASSPASGPRYNFTFTWGTDRDTASPRD